MKRTFRSKQLVRLPSLNANRGLVLGEKLIAAAEAEGVLPEPVRIALVEVRRRRDSLHRIASERVATPTDVADSHRKEVHAAEVAAWSALRSRVIAYGRLAKNAGVANDRAKVIEDAIFQDSLKFLQLSWEEAWMEAERRLTLIDQRKLEDEIRYLAGDLFFEKVREAHREAGEVLRITQPKELVKDEPQLKKPLDEFVDAVREYVVQVSASASHAEPGAADRADRLLDPLADLKSISKKKAKAEAPTPAAPTASTPNPT